MPVRRADRRTIDGMAQTPEQTPDTQPSTGTSRVPIHVLNCVYPLVPDEVRLYFRDVLDNTRRAVTRSRWLNDTLGSMIEIAGLLEQSRQGKITRQLAAWAAILAVPTAIAGIYGMNFDFMPELNWRYGYFVVVGAMALVCTGLFVRFKRIGWL